MTQEERRIWLIRYLEAEMPEYSKYGVPARAESQWSLLRGLFNVRPPKPATDEFFSVEGELLREMTCEKGVTDVASLKPVAFDERMYLWQGDITALKVDAIVNAANSKMLGCWQAGHTCIDNAIHTFAGVELRMECDEIMRAQGHDEPTGEAKITKGYNLPAKYVLHTVGPIVYGPLTEDHKALLASSYTSCLELAKKNGLSSVAFCCISTGVFMFPKREASEIAVRIVKKWLDQNESNIKVVFNVFLDDDLMIYRELLDKGIRLPYSKSGRL